MPGRDTGRTAARSAGTTRAGADPARSTSAATAAEDADRRRGRRRGRDLLGLAAASVVGAAVVAGFVSFRIWQQGERDDRRPADAIVVMGAAQYDGRPSPVFRARLDHAVELYRAGVASILVVTGGGAEGDRTTEAAVARAYAVAAGVPPEAILAEDRGRTTAQSLAAVGAMLRDRELTDAVFVSDRTHMLRVLRIAIDEGLDARGSPAPDSPTEAGLPSRLDAMLHELGALTLYFLGAADRG